MARTWLRLYTDICESQKIQLLPPEDFKILINLWAVAKDHDGVLPSIQKIAWRLRVPEATLQATLGRLLDAALFECCDGRWVPHDWDKHQYRSDGPSTARASKSKAKKLKDISESPSDATLQATTRQHCRAEQSRAEQNNSPTPLLDFADLVEAVAAAKWANESIAYDALNRHLASAVNPQAAVGVLRKHLPGYCRAYSAKRGKYQTSFDKFLREGRWAGPCADDPTPDSDTATPYRFFRAEGYGQ